MQEPNYHTTKFFTETLLAVEMEKKKKKNRDTYQEAFFYLGFSILELSKILMCHFWYNYVTPKMVKKPTCVIWYKQFHCIHKNR